VGDQQNSVAHVKLGWLVEGRARGHGGISIAQMDLRMPFAYAILQTV
jgi:hypothetical protein